MKKRILIFFTIIVCILLVMISIPIINMLQNNLTLKKYSKQLFIYPVPPSTQELSRDSKVGIQFANGDHCDFKAERIFETTLTKEEIMEYYKDASIQAAKNTSNVKIEVNFIENDKLIYQIVAMDGGYSANFDIRCM